MKMSARTLGYNYGLSAEEMNRVLFKLGFLKGEPGDYNLTEKALQYASSRECHRGTGGYSCYNRYWTQRTYDESIKSVLDVTPELVDEVRKEIAADRAARYAAQAVARAQADADFLAKQATEKAKLEALEIENMKTEKFIANLKKAGKFALVVGGVIVIGYSIYKVTPKVKSWWDERKNNNKIEEASSCA